MAQIVLLMICLAIGWILRQSGALSEDGTKSLSSWVINVALPAVALLRISGVELSEFWIIAAATPWAGALLAWLLFRLIARPLGLSRATLGTLILVGGWGNTSFVGIPMVVAYFGSKWLGLVLVIDVLGSYLALSTLGILIASLHSEEKATAVSIVKRILTFPPFIAVVLALATNPLPRPPWINEMLEPVANTLTPIAMAAVGSALRFRDLGRSAGLIALGLGYRLLAAPALLLLIYIALGLRHHDESTIAIFEMAMPPMLGASIIAMRYGLNDELVVGLIGVGIPLSMLTLPLWSRMLTM